MRSWWKRWRMRRLTHKAHKVLVNLNASMIAAGLSRPERRRVWRDLYKDDIDAVDLLARG